MDTLPPGNIFDLAENLNNNKKSTTTEQSSTPKQLQEEVSVEDLSLPHKQIENLQKSTTATSSSSAVSSIISNSSSLNSLSDSKISQNAIDMLAQLFPQRKRAVLELVLKRCDSDLVKAIENISTSYKDYQEDVEDARIVEKLETKETNIMKSAFKPVYSSGNMVSLEN